MLHRRFGTRRGRGPSSDFAQYYMDLQATGRTDIPTPKEAKKDFEERQRFQSYFSA